MPDQSIAGQPADPVGPGTSMQSIPASVAGYFAFALPATNRRILRARLDWAGTILLKRGGRAKSFTAREAFITAPPGFMWDAEIAMFPGARVHVRDSYDAGRGKTNARLFGVVPVMNQPGTPQTAESALQRFLGEALWFPTALQPEAGVVWKVIDADSATATLVDRANRASVDFHFGERGEVVACSALRYRDVGNQSLLTPWRTRTWDYESVDGIMVPRSAEAEWLLPDGPLTYWRGAVERATYEYESGTGRDAQDSSTSEIRS